MFLCLSTVCFLPASGNNILNNENTKKIRNINLKEQFIRKETAKEDTIEVKLTAFAKSCIAHLFQKDMLKHCFEAKNLNGVMELVGNYLGFESKPENFEFFIGTDTLCYSYNLVREKENGKKRVSRCYAAAELTDLLLKWLLKSPVFNAVEINLQSSLKKQNQKSDDLIFDVYWMILFLPLAGAAALYLFQIVTKKAIAINMKQKCQKYVSLKYVSKHIKFIIISLNLYYKLSVSLANHAHLNKLVLHFNPEASNPWVTQILLRELLAFFHMT